MEGNGKWFRWMALLRSVGSMHNFTSPFDLRIANQLDIHGVGTSTLAITFCSSRAVIFFCRSSLRAYATLRGLFCTGLTLLSITMSYSPGRHPSPENTSVYSSSISVLKSVHQMYMFVHCSKLRCRHVSSDSSEQCFVSTTSNIRGTLRL